MDKRVTALSHVHGLPLTTFLFIGIKLSRLLFITHVSQIWHCKIKASKWCTKHRWQYAPLCVGYDSSVSIAIRYGLDGPRIKSRPGLDFLHLSRLALGPTQPPTQGVLGPSRGVKWLGCGIDHPLPSSAEVKERVELYLYSPYKPSWPVLGWTLPLPLPVYLSKYNCNLHTLLHPYSHHVSSALHSHDTVLVNPVCHVCDISGFSPFWNL